MEEVRKEEKPCKKALFLYSSSTGKPKKNKKWLPEITARLEAIFDLESHKTSSIEEAERLAIESCGKYDALILLGGDGTLCHIASCLSGRENAPILGYLPGGTLNDGGKNFGANSIEKALRNIEKGESRAFDMMKVGDSRAFYLGGFGAYMDVSYVAKRKAKKFLGRFVYYLICIKEMFSFRRYQVEIEGEQGYKGRACIIAAMNGKWIGGMKTNSKGSPGDGKLELLIVPPRLFNGFLSFFFHAGFITLSGSRFHIHVDKEIEWCIDGEPGPKGDLEIELLPASLKAYCDPSIL